MIRLLLVLALTGCASSVHQVTSTQRPASPAPDHSPSEAASDERAQLQARGLYRAPNGDLRALPVERSPAKSLGGRPAIAQEPAVITPQKPITLSLPQ